MEKIVTNNGKKGGWLHGKPHYRKDGKSAGGIKAVVTDAGNKPVELEGGEVIINKEASKKHWKELSRINQSAGGGVPITPPDGADEDPSEYKSGGNVIEFNANHIPSKWILSYAEKIKTKYPEIWKLGGNIFGNEAYVNLKRVAERGYWLDSEEWMYIKWRAYVARHHKDFRIEGVIAMLKWVDKVDKGWAYMKNLIEERIDKIESKKDKKGWKHKMKKGGDVSEVDIEKRWDKKRNGIKTLSNNIQSLRYNLTKDLQSEDEKVFLTALAISLMDSSGERVGNEESANNGHFGITGFEKKHIKIDGDKITLNYIGKSSVTHNKSFTDKKLSEGLKKAIKNSNSSLVFCTSDGFNIKADKINRYLQDYDISAKDLRGYLANKLVIYKLDANIKDEKERKKKFNEILESVADSVGHGRATLKTHYLLPEIETLYVEKGKVFDIKNYGSGGNLSKTPAPKSERIYGSKTNKSGSAESKESAKSIKFDESLITTIKDKIKGTGVSLDTAKAVVRRGMGAYSSTHRPTITGGKPNSRTAWGLARLNAFLYKKEHGKSKSGKYFQDDDLMKYGGEIKDITCKSCNWSWNKSDSEKHDEYVCHKCGTDNKMKSGGELENINWKELSNKENKKYYTELAKMENKFAEGGLILPNGIEVNVGDEGTYTGRLNIDIRITKITESRVYFVDIKTNEANSKNKDNFSKQFRPNTSLTTGNNQTKPVAINEKTTLSQEKETQADFNARKNMYFKEGDYFYFGNDTSEWYKITEYNKNVVNPTFGTTAVKYIDENGKELVVPEDDFKNIFDLKEITLIYNPPIKKPSYQVGDYFKSNVWRNNNWARIDKIDRYEITYTLENDGKTNTPVEKANKLFESSIWYLIPDPTKPLYKVGDYFKTDTWINNDWARIDKIDKDGITYSLEKDGKNSGGRNISLKEANLLFESKTWYLIPDPTKPKKRRTYTDSYIAYCDEVYRFIFEDNEDYAKTLLTKDGYNDFFDRVVGVGFSDQWDAIDTAGVLFQLNGCEAKDEWNEGELVYWIGGQKEKVITKKDYNPDKSVYYELDGELGWFSAQSFVTAPSNLLKKEPKKSKQPAPAIVKKNEIAKNSEQSLRMWMGANMVKHTKLNSSLLAEKSLLDFTDNLKLLDDKTENSITNFGKPGTWSKSDFRKSQISEFYGNEAIALTPFTDMKMLGANVKIELNSDKTYNWVVYDKKGKLYKKGDKFPTQQQALDEFQNTKFKDGGLIAPNSKKSNLSEQHDNLGVVIKLTEEKLFPEEEEQIIKMTTPKSTIIPKNSFYAWLYNDINADKKIISGEYDLIKFKSAIGDFWKNNNAKGGENLIAILKGRISDDEGKIYIMTMTTKPSYRKRGAMSFLIKKVRDEFNLDRDDVYFVGLTDKGKKFYNKKRFGYGGVSFADNQIKLADGTNTTFDGSNPDIRFDKGVEVEMKEIESESFDKYLSFTIGNTNIHFEYSKLDMAYKWGEWSIAGLSVPDKDKRKGYATKLLMSAMNYLKGVGFLAQVSNDISVDLHYKLGFRAFKYGEELSLEDTKKERAKLTSVRMESPDYFKNKNSNSDIRFKEGGNTEQYKTIAFFTNKKFKIFDGKKSFTDIKKQFGITPLRLEVIKVKTKDLSNNNLFIKWSENELLNKYNEVLYPSNLYFSIIKEGENNIVKNAFWENELTGEKYEYDAENITWVKK